MTTHQLEDAVNTLATTVTPGEVDAVEDKWGKACDDSLSAQQLYGLQNLANELEKTLSCVRPSFVTPSY